MRTPPSSTHVWSKGLGSGAILLCVSMWPWCSTSTRFTVVISWRWTCQACFFIRLFIHPDTASTGSLPFDRREKVSYLPTWEAIMNPLFAIWRWRGASQSYRRWLKVRKCWLYHGNAGHRTGLHFRTRSRKSAWISEKWSKWTLGLLTSWHC